jgi:hypothetical protein
VSDQPVRGVKRSVRYVALSLWRRLPGRLNGSLGVGHCVAAPRRLAPPDTYRGMGID